MNKSELSKELWGLYIAWERAENDLSQVFGQPDTTVKYMADVAHEKFDAFEQAINKADESAYYEAVNELGSNADEMLLWQRAILYAIGEV